MNRSTGEARRSYRPLVDVCAEFGIRRTRAFQLVREGHIESFKIGRRTFCYVDSVETLPARLGRIREQAK